MFQEIKEKRKDCFVCRFMLCWNDGTNFSFSIFFNLILCICIFIYIFNFPSSFLPFTSLICSSFLYFSSVFRCSFWTTIFEFDLYSSTQPYIYTNKQSDFKFWSRNFYIFLLKNLAYRITYHVPKSDNNRENFAYINLP